MEGLAAEEDVLAIPYVLVCAAGLGGGGAFNGAHVWVRQGEMMAGSVWNI